MLGRSRLGRPDMSMDLEDWTASPAQDLPMTPVDDDDDIFASGPPPGGCLGDAQLPSDGFLVFAPPTMTDDDFQTAPAPCHTEDQLPKGIDVWVCDEHEVVVRLGGCYVPGIAEVCNGRHKGVVVFHRDRWTCVRFVIGAVHLTHILPRECLSKIPIEPYDSRQNGKIESLHVAMDGKVTGGAANARRPEETMLLQQYFDLLCLPQDPPFLTAVESLHRGRVADCLERCAAVLSDADPPGPPTPHGAPPAAAPRPPPPPTAADAAPPTARGALRGAWLAVRSMGRMFGAQEGGALQDALRAMEADPANPAGYVRAARAHAALGNFAACGRMITHVGTMIHLCREYDAVVKCHLALQRQQTALFASSLKLKVDAYYVKRLTTAINVPRRRLIVHDANIIVAAPSLTNDAAVFCHTCVAPDAPLVESNGETVVYYCSEECREADVEVLALEIGSRGTLWKSAQFLISNRSTTTVQHLPLEAAKLALRLYLRALVLIRRDASCRAAKNVEVIKEKLGLLPCPSIRADNKTRDDLEVLHRVVSAIATEEEREYLPFTLFLSLYEFAFRYAARVEVFTKDGRHLSAYVVSEFATCVDRVEDSGANCEVHRSGRGLMLSARIDIPAHTHLSIPIESS